MGAGIKVTVAVAGALVPPMPLHTNEYVLVAAMRALICEPLGERFPLQAPEALQESAFVELQLSVAAPPRATDVGVAVSVAVGKGFTVTVALAGALVPPGPEQVIE